MLISRSQLLSAKCASKDVTKRALAHVLVNADGSTCVTDGRQLLWIERTSRTRCSKEIITAFGLRAKWTLPKIPYEGLLVPAELLLDALRDLPSKPISPLHQFVLIESFDDAKVNLVVMAKTGPRNLSGTRGNDKYPDYKAAIPRETPKLSIAFNLSYIDGMLAQVRGVMTTKIMDSINNSGTLEFMDNTSPMVLKAANGEERVTALCMPLNMPGNG